MSHDGTAHSVGIEGEGAIKGGGEHGARTAWPRLDPLAPSRAFGACVLGHGIAQRCAVSVAILAGQMRGAKGASSQTERFRTQPMRSTLEESPNSIVRSTIDSQSGADLDTRRRAGRGLAGLITAARPPSATACSCNFQAPLVSGTGSCFPTHSPLWREFSLSRCRSVRVCCNSSCSCSCSPCKIREINLHHPVCLPHPFPQSPPSRRHRPDRSASAAPERISQSRSSSAQPSPLESQPKAAYTAHRVSTRHSILEHQLHHPDSASLLHAHPPVFSHCASIDTAAASQSRYTSSRTHVHSNDTARQTHVQAAHTYTPQSPPQDE